MAVARLLPPLLALGLGALSFTPRVRDNAALSWSFWGAALALLVGYGLLILFLRDRFGSRRVRLVLRPQHYVQALVQVSVLVYWGYFWRPVYEFAVLLLAQLLFAYAVDLLLAWSRRAEHHLGFGPVPIIFSINLFLWFRDDWFYLQFLMIAIGFLGKEFIRWEREGRLVHIFNPSAFTLGLFSLALIATNGTSLTWGREIASTLTLAPWIYTFLFAAGLVVMYFFSITLVAAAAAAVLFLLSAVYASLTGVPYFLDSEIPAAVFLGLHLLITDPSTSPRSPSGKLVFGGLYGVGVFALYGALGAAGVPTFYDKLLCVPLLNLSVRGIEAAVQSAKEREWTAWRWGDWVATRSNLALMGVWVLFFLTMTGLGRTDGSHPGDRVPFWQQACEDDRRNACARLLQLEASYCGDNSAWACNELGRHYREGRVTEVEPSVATRYFERACELRFQAACLNLLDTSRALAAPPKELDLRLLLREGGLNLMEATPADLYRRACRHGWRFACSAPPALT